MGLGFLETLGALEAPGTFLSKDSADLRALRPVPPLSSCVTWIIHITSLSLGPCLQKGTVGAPAPSDCPERGMRGVQVCVHVCLCTMCLWGVAFLVPAQSLSESLWDTGPSLPAGPYLPSDQHGGGGVGCH